MKWYKAGEKLPKHNQKVKVRYFAYLELVYGHPVYSNELVATYKELKNKHRATVCYWHFNDASAIRLTVSDEWAEIEQST